MKKNSKTVERHPAETIGIDLGDKMSRYAILNEEGLVVVEGSFRNRMESIAKHFGNRGRARVALDRTRVHQAGSRSDRGQCARVEVDHLQRYQERSQRRPEAGALGAGGPESAGSGGASHRRAAGGVGGDPGARRAGSVADAAGQHGAQFGRRGSGSGYRRRSRTPSAHARWRGWHSICIRP
jgi:hypothetical protein